MEMKNQIRLSEEFFGVTLPDARLEPRLLRLVDSLEEDPSRSFPQATGDEAGREAAYRFLNNPQVSMEALLQGHIQNTLERARSQGQPVLALHDTTEFVFPGATGDRGVFQGVEDRLRV